MKLAELPQHNSLGFFCWGRSLKIHIETKREVFTNLIPDKHWSRSKWSKWPINVLNEWYDICGWGHWKIFHTDSTQNTILFCCTYVYLAAVRWRCSVPYGDPTYRRFRNRNSGFKRTHCEWFHATFPTYWKQRTLVGRQRNTKKNSLVKQSYI